MRPYATSVCGLTLRVYAALRYYIYTAGGVLLWLLHLKMPSNAQTHELQASLLKWHYGLRLPKICPSHAARAWWSAVEVLSLLALLVQKYKYGLASSGETQHATGKIIDKRQQESWCT